MPFVIITTANARRDIEQAMEWEDHRSPGLGDRFWVDLCERLDALGKTPHMGTVRYLNVRCTTTHIFQYLIHYTVDNATQSLTILRVLHTSRKPEW